MPVTKKTFAKCGHKGLGVYCHRCAEADRMEACAKEDFPKCWKKKFPPSFHTQEGKPRPGDWFLHEAARLRR